MTNMLTKPYSIDEHIPYQVSSTKYQPSNISLVVFPTSLALAMGDIKNEMATTTRLEERLEHCSAQDQYPCTLGGAGPVQPICSARYGLQQRQMPPSSLRVLLSASIMTLHGSSL